MPNEMINLREIYDKIKIDLAPDYAETIFVSIEGLVKAVFLDPDEETRARLAKTLDECFGNILERGFMADNQLFIVLCYECSERTFYVCDMPKTYIGSPSKPHRFYRKK